MQSLVVRKPPAQSASLSPLTKADVGVRGDVFRCVREGDLTAVRKLIQEGGIDVNARGGQLNSSPLLAACQFHQTNVASLLLGLGANIASKGGGMWSAMHHACAGKDDPELIQLLLEAAGRAETDIVDARDYMGRTPLHICSMNGNHSAVVLLLRAGANENSRDSQGRAALHLAATQGSRPVVKALLDNGADIEARDFEKETPLFYATRSKRYLIADVLIKRGADAHAVNCWGELADSLAKDYKMNPAPPPEPLDKCIACAGIGNKHYYYCKKEVLEKLPPHMIIRPDGTTPAPVKSRQRSQAFRENYAKMIITSM